MLQRVSKEEVGLVMNEVHNGIWGSHIDGRALSGKILRADQYWPNMLHDCARFVNHCEKYQIYAPFISIPTELLYSLIPPGHFINGGLAFWVFFLWLQIN